MEVVILVNKFKYDVLDNNLYKTLFVNKKIYQKNKQQKQSNSKIAIFLKECLNLQFLAYRF